MKNNIITMLVLIMVSMSLIAKDLPETAKAKIFFNSQEYDNAIEWFEKAIEKDKENSELYLWLAKTYLADINNVNFFSKGLYSSKIKSNLKISIEKDPRNIDARHYLASYYFNAPAIGGGDKDEAWNQVKEIAKLSPERAHEIKAQFYQQGKEFDKAITEYNELLKLNPENSHTYYLIGIMHQQTEDFDKALINFEKALSIDPISLESLYQVGRNAVFSKKNLDKGIEALNKYLKYNPDKSLPALDAAYWRLALIYQIKDDTEKAKEAVSKAISINDKNDDYKKLLKELN